MPNYVRAFQPGGTFFLTLVTFDRRPIFNDRTTIARLRASLRTVKRERPFDVLAAVVLPDHLHFLWTLPYGDTDFSTRVGRFKALFTKSFAGTKTVGSAHPTPSRARRRESDVWQRRFWEHTIRDQDDLNLHLDYIHYNPVKHGLATCPHAHAASSFRTWVRRGAYAANWLCTCRGPATRPPDFTRLDARAME